MPTETPNKNFRNIREVRGKDNFKTLSKVRDEVDIRHLELDNERLESEIKRYEQDTKLKFLVAWFVISYASLFTFIVLSIVSFSGKPPCVINTLITGFLFEILALVKTLCVHLFPKHR